MLAQFATAHQAIVDNGGAVIGVAPAAGFQATHLMETTIPYELLMDRDHELSRGLDVGTQSFARFILNLDAWRRYSAAFARNRRQGRITEGYATLPALFLVDADACVTYLHRGAGIADYPPLAEVLGELAELL